LKFTSSDPRASTVDSQSGAALLFLLVTLVALMGIGAVTMLAVRPEVRPTLGAGRAEALDAAESGVAAALIWLRRGCDRGVLPVRPPHPELFGNGVQAGQPGHPFRPEASLWYEVTIENDPTDPGGAVDTDGRLLIRSVGRCGRAEIVVEAEVDDPGCPGELVVEAARTVGEDPERP
jgi:hypothetical protein